MKNQKILFLLSFILLFTPMRAQHLHGSEMQSAQRVREIIFGNYLAKIYLPKIELNQEFELKVEIEDKEMHNLPEGVRIFLNVNYLDATPEDSVEISRTKELEMVKPGKYFLKEKLSRPGSYDLVVKFVDEQTGVEKEVIFEVELLKPKNFWSSMMDMHGTMMYGAIGIAVMIIMMAIKFIF